MISLQIVSVINVEYEKQMVNMIPSKVVIVAVIISNWLSPCTSGISVSLGIYGFGTIIRTTLL